MVVMSYQANFTFNPYPLETNPVSGTCPYRPAHVIDNGYSLGSMVIAPSVYQPHRDAAVTPVYTINPNMPDTFTAAQELPIPPQNVVVQNGDQRPAPVTQNLPLEPPATIPYYPTSDQNANREG
jgi:hypothetical protein